MSSSRRRGERPWSTAIVMVILAGAGGCGGDGQAASNTGGGRPGGGGGGSGGPTPVEISTVERTSLARTSVVTGQLAAVRAVGVNAQVGGALLEVHVEEGSRVRR